MNSFHPKKYSAIGLFLWLTLSLLLTPLEIIPRCSTVGLDFGIIPTGFNVPLGFEPQRLKFLMGLTESLAQSPAQLTYQQIFKENAPAVVLIRMVDSSKKIISIGSGFVVSPMGVIVTNHHVIKAKPDARLEIKMPNGDVYTDVWIIHEEERRDLAVIWIKTTRLPTVKLGDSDNVEVGEQVVALGNPKGLELTFTAGIVSHIRLMPEKGYRFIQHQTPISPGSSGGPLFNMKGEVIGINTFAFEGQNLNGAVSINYVKPYLQDPPKMTYEEYAALQRQIEPPKVAPLSVQPCNEIIGSWNWFNGVVVIVESGGTMRREDNKNFGTWTCVDAVQRKFVLNWSKWGWRDTLILSSDGRKLDGRNQWGGHVWGNKK